MARVTPPLTGESGTLSSGVITVAGALTGLRTFADALADADTVYVAVKDASDVHSWRLATWDETAGTLTLGTEDGNTGTLSDGAVEVWAAPELGADIARPFPPRSSKTAAATTDFELDGTAYTCQLSADITTWTASLPSGGNAASYEYHCRIDFTPPASGTFTVTIPGAWEQAGPLDAISLSNTDTGILVVLSTKADGTIVYTAQALA